MLPEATYMNNADSARVKAEYIKLLLLILLIIYFFSNIVDLGRNALENKFYFIAFLLVAGFYWFQKDCGWYESTRWITG